VASCRHSDAAFQSLGSSSFGMRFAPQWKFLDAAIGTHHSLFMLRHSTVFFKASIKCPPRRGSRVVEVDHIARVAAS
jgi:hypothetical protein